MSLDNGFADFEQFVSQYLNQVKLLQFLGIIESALNNRI
jgi:hypothetical protein